MLSQKQINVIATLQRIYLDTLNTAVLLQTLFPKVLEQLVTVGINYQFLGGVFIDPQDNIKQSIFVDVNFKAGYPKPIQSVLNVALIFSHASDIEQKIASGDIVLLTNPAYLLASSYYAFSQIKTIILSPILISNELSGVLILASVKEAKQIKEDELEMVKLLTNLIGVSYRLQDSQSSLTSITQEIYKVNAKLHKLDNLKDDFVSIASHELRTPMTAIRSYVWMALHRSDVPLSEKLRRYLYRTLVSTERLINLVNDMLNVSRIESGSIEINPKPFDILDLVCDVVDEVKLKADEKLLKLQVIDEKLPLIFGDPDKVHQILLNLIGNSIKFTSPNGVISVSFFPDGQSVDVSIKDTGVGLAHEDLSKLFHKFSRLDSSYVSIGSSGGTGLGLYISKSLIDLMHGKIWAVSDGVDKGTTITFSLPIATEDLIKMKEKFHIKPTGDVKSLETTVISSV